MSDPRSHNVRADAIRDRAAPHVCDRSPDRVELDARPADQHLAVHAPELLVAGSRVGAVPCGAPRRASTSHSMSRPTGSRSPISPRNESAGSSSRTPNASSPYVQCSNGVSHVSSAHSPSARISSPWRGRPTSWSRTTIGPGRSGSEQMRPPPRDAERRRGREPHREPDAVVGRRRRDATSPTTTTIGRRRVRTLVGGARTAVTG